MITKGQYDALESLLPQKIIDMRHEEYAEKGYFSPFTSHLFRVRRAKGRTDPPEVKELVDKIIESPMFFHGVKLNAKVVAK
jgi:hypothetical protein